eukprot:UN21639
MKNISGRMKKKSSLRLLFVEKLSFWQLLDLFGNYLMDYSYIFRKRTFINKWRIDMTT